MPSLFIKSECSKTRSNVEFQNFPREDPRIPRFIEREGVGTPWSFGIPPPPCLNQALGKPVDSVCRVGEKWRGTKPTYVRRSVDISDVPSQASRRWRLLSSKLSIGAQRGDGRTGSARRLPIPLLWELKSPARWPSRGCSPGVDEVEGRVDRSTNDLMLCWFSVATK